MSEHRVAWTSFRSTTHFGQHVLQYPGTVTCACGWTSASCASEDELAQAFGAHATKGSSDMPDDKKPSVAAKIFGEMKELVKAEVEQIRADTRRLDWLEKNPDELEWVRGRVNNEGGTVREAIDWFIARRASKED